MLNNFDYSIEYESEINSFEKQIHIPKEALNTQFIKKILFINKFRMNFDQKNKHYKSCLIYDILTLIYHMQNGTERTYKNYYRSVIENYLRVMLKLKNNDSKGVNDLFRSFKKLSSNQNYKELYNFFELKYSDCCNYVHSNIQAGYNIHEYYKDIINYENTQNNNLINLVEDLDSLLTNMISGIVILYHTELANIFYRRVDEIQFLAGEDIYSLFRNLKFQDEISN